MARKMTTDVVGVDRKQRFNDILVSYKQLVCKICYMYAVDKHHFNDLYQEVLLNIWQGLSSFRGDAGISSWVYRIAVNSCISCYRRNKVMSHSVPLDGMTDMVSEEPDKVAQLNELYRLIGCLNPMDKAIIMMWLDEKSYIEIAEVTGLSRNNVASRLHRIREKLVKMSSE